MTIDISNNAARVNYTVAQGATQTSFSVPFEFFNDADLSVYVDDVLKTITTHYTVSGGDGSTGTVTISVTGASGGSTVVISRSIAIERTSDFVTGVDINRAALNTQLDTLTAIAADNKDKASRSISAPNSEVNPQLELPDADTRKGKLVGFNETTGNVELSATLADGNTLASISGDIATLADIEDGTDATDAIQTVAGISSDVTTVAGISANVTSVAGNSSNINTVAADEADIGTVAGSIVSVNTNAANITDIQNASANAATATTKASEAATSATNAATSETNAATSESNAATSASTATTQAGISTTKAGEASVSAAAALASEGAASTSETNSANSAANSSNSATLSEASRIASVAAQAAAETAETNAETAETNAAASASSASTSASNASTSQTNAASSAASASTDAGTATTKAGEAATSATAAASSASSAQASKDAALAALDSFDDRYLGQKTSDPTVDNDGDALVSGALYFNTTDDIMKVYDGSLWVAAYASLSGAMFGANNLSDVASISASRTTLGLGTGDTPTFAGINTTSNATFGDNDKAIFGAGSDLQIWHDTANSNIRDVGTGFLGLDTNGSDVRLTSGSNAKVMGYFEKDGPVYLYYDGNGKFATTSSGCDINGTLTSDGLTVDNSGTIQFNDPQATDTILIGTNDNDLVIRTDDGVIQLKTNENKVGFQLANNGDISFYEDTGTTPKFFWDASAERLGIGTSSPSNDIHISSSSGTKAVFERTGSTGAYIGLKDSSGSNVYLGDNNGTFEVQTAGSSYSTKLAVTSGGNVGIGVTTPRGLLHVNQATASSDAIIRITNSNTPSTGNHRVEFADGTGTSEGSTVFRYAYIAGERSGGSNDGHFIVGTKPNNSSAPTERMRIDSSGNVGIGHSPTYKVDVAGTNPALRLKSSSGFGYIIDQNTSNGLVSHIVYENVGMRFGTNSTERMRIDSSGNLLVGKTSSSSTTEGAEIFGDGYQFLTKEGVSLYLTRPSTDGEMLRFLKGIAKVGSIGTFGDDLTIGTGDTGFKFSDSSDGIMPFNVSTNAFRDGAIDLGHSSVRFEDIYATNGTIQTSDRNEKQDIEVLSDAETRVAQACKGLLRKFRWQDAVAEKGDDARIHFGIIAQDLQDAFAAEGLDAGRYAMFISSTWTDEETGEERTRLGVRYPELLAFIIGAM